MTMTTLQQPKVHQPTKPKTPAGNKMGPDQKTATKTHRRSRTGCFTCRLRRKKCDEGKPLCKACKNLGLCCDYKRPQWWGNADSRKRQKEHIKMIIKRTKMTEKVAMSPLSADSPPELSRSLPTSDSLSDSIARARSLSLESQVSFGDAYDVHHMQPDIFNPEAMLHAHNPYAAYPTSTQPYDVTADVHQIKQEFFNFAPPPMGPRRDSVHSMGSRRGSMYQDPFLPQTSSIHSDDLSAQQFFDFHTYPQPDLRIPIDEADRPLLDHFIHNVLRLIFPILDLHGSARHDVIMNALATNECYRHCCLSIAALHLKSTQQDVPVEWVDQDITRHRYATISGLCDALARDVDHLQILEATLGMILFQCTVGTPEDSLPDIPWHQHFQAAVSLVNKLDLPSQLGTSYAPPSLNMTLTAWIDILGATMQGTAPVFADTYREKHLSNAPSGLRELMGCDDRVMYLISEIACLEALKNQRMLNDIDLCEHVKSLAHQIDLTEPNPDHVVPPVVQSGNLDPRALTQHMTSAFRYAARIYLCSLVPGFDRTQPQVLELLNKLTACLEGIPAGPDGFDRSLVWVYLIGGSVATEGSRYRRFFGRRAEMMGQGRDVGSFGRVRRLLSEVWQGIDAHEPVDWRGIAKNLGGGEYLLV